MTYQLHFRPILESHCLGYFLRGALPAFRFRRKAFALSQSRRCPLDAVGIRCQQSQVLETRARLIRWDAGGGHANHFSQPLRLRLAVSLDINKNLVHTPHS